MNSSGSDEKYDSECAQQFSRYLDTTNPFKSECIKCMNYLKNLDDSSDLDYQKRGIIYLYLWLQQYELRNKINHANTLDFMKNLTSSFERISQPMANIHYVYDNHVKKFLNNELNDLFSLYEKFDNFQNNQVCRDKCKCAHECVDTYMKSLEKPNTNSNMYLCNELENFRKKYYEHKPSETECPGVQSYLPSCKKYSTSVIILISFITISVLSSLLFILYKFTPFGSRFGFRSKRPQRIYSNFTNEEANLLYTKGKSKTPEAKPYNIAYTSI